MIGNGGIEHVLLPEKGYVHTGDPDRGCGFPTCTYGAFGAFSTGIGSTDMAAAMLTGELVVPGSTRNPQWISAVKKKMGIRKGYHSLAASPDQRKMARTMLP